MYQKDFRQPVLLPEIGQPRMESHTQAKANEKHTSGQKKTVKDLRREKVPDGKKESQEKIIKITFFPMI